MSDGRRGRSTSGGKKSHPIPRHRTVIQQQQWDVVTLVVIVVFLHHVKFYSR